MLRRSLDNDTGFSHKISVVTRTGILNYSQFLNQVGSKMDVLYKNIDEPTVKFISSDIYSKTYDNESILKIHANHSRSSLSYQVDSNLEFLKRQIPQLDHKKQLKKKDFSLGTNGSIIKVEASPINPKIDSRFQTSTNSTIINYNIMKLKDDFKEFNATEESKILEFLELLGATYNCSLIQGDSIRYRYNIEHVKLLCEKFGLKTVYHKAERNNHLKVVSRKFKKFVVKFFDVDVRSCVETVQINEVWKLQKKSLNPEIYQMPSNYLEAFLKGCCNIKNLNGARISTRSKEYLLSLVHLTIITGFSPKVKVSNESSSTGVNLRYFLQILSEPKLTNVMVLGGMTQEKFSGVFYNLAPDENAINDPTNDGFELMVIINIEENEEGDLKSVSYPLVVRSTLMDYYEDEDENLEFA
ncbi:hypothetical protein KGF54_004192 [Candida jiufengensis]|uniref:uncharacterized protein n=1 Tax=Candida jiufengensis TaxID=497108 RepID=UPI0022254088|nr:uncharacterized protein KGF54_004192 [Candida jiufengensis]KAI5951118.1 hypothetical protein KGF54_004192 [Candida jiufengensis]